MICFYYVKKKRPEPKISPSKKVQRDYVALQKSLPQGAQSNSAPLNRLNKTRSRFQGLQLSVGVPESSTNQGTKLTQNTRSYGLRFKEWKEPSKLIFRKRWMWFASLKTFLTEKPLNILPLLRSPVERTTEIFCSRKPWIAQSLLGC